MAGAIRRFPFLADAEAIRLVCHPDAMTPDANPLLGPLPGVHGFWVAAGLSLNGFGGGGGIGRAMAGWITAGDPGVDIGPYRAWRFGDVYRDPGFVAGLAREAYADYYRLRYPYDADVAGRPRRLSALHGRLQESGAVFGTKAGWERADYHDPGRPWRRAGRDQAAYGWTTPAWFERVAEEARAVRERAGIIDLSSFGKIEVTGPGALALLQRVGANDVDRPVGSLVYTQWCDERGGMVADVTVARLADERFRVVTGAGYVASELAWLRTHVVDGDDPVSIRDVSGDLATIGLWGPNAREILAAAAPATTSATPLSRCAGLAVDPGGRRAGRRGADQLRRRARLGADDRRRLGGRRSGMRCCAAGAAHGLEPFGYRALDALRMEKGYRYYGTDLTMLDTPFEAGLGAFVRLDKGAVHRARGPRRGARGRTRTGRRAGCGRCSSAVLGTCRSTAAKRSGGTARSSAGCAASPTARPSSAPSRTRTCPPTWPRATTSRWTCSTSGSRRPSRRTSWSIRPAIGCAGRVGASHATRPPQEPALHRRRFQDGSAHAEPSGRPPLDALALAASSSHPGSFASRG